MDSIRLGGAERSSEDHGGQGAGRSRGQGGAGDMEEQGTGRRRGHGGRAADNIFLDAMLN